MDPLDRYASPEMTRVWDNQNRTQLEHELWLEVMCWQATQNPDLGITEQVRNDYQEVANRYILDGRYRGLYDLWVLEAEIHTHHDTQARIEVFDREAGGHGKIHLGMTSADVVEHVYSAQTDQALQLMIHMAKRVGDELLSRFVAHRDTPIVGRTHNRPAQPTTLGYRFQCLADHQEWAIACAYAAMRHQPRRGVRGAVGNRRDLLDLIGCQPDEPYPSLPPSILGDQCTAQTPPRTWDLDATHQLLLLCAPALDLANMVRHMAGRGQAMEQFDPGQVGSSAMPHKRNPILSERIVGLTNTLRGYHQMILGTVGTAWLEGDVTTSSTRRVALPGAFKTADAILRLAQGLSQGLQFDLGQIEAELDEHRLDINTGRLLSLLIGRGIPRQQAHHKIIEAYAASRGGAADAWTALVYDPGLPLTFDDLSSLWANVGLPPKDSPGRLVTDHQPADSEEPTPDGVG